MPLDVEALRKVAALSGPAIRPMDGEYYPVILDAERYRILTQWHWNRALEAARRQLGRLRYWQ